MAKEYESTNIIYDQNGEPKCLPTEGIGFRLSFLFLEPSFVIAPEMRAIKQIHFLLFKILLPFWEMRWLCLASNRCRLTAFWLKQKRKIEKSPNLDLFLCFFGFFDNSICLYFLSNSNFSSSSWKGWKRWMDMFGCIVEKLVAKRDLNLALFWIFFDSCKVQSEDKTE